MATEREQAFHFLRTSRRGGKFPPMASELAYGVLRHRLRLDWIVERASGRKKAAIDPPHLDVLRLGAYQLLFTPSVPRYAAVYESVELAKKVLPKAAGFANWVLRRIGPEYLGLPRREDFTDEGEWMSTFYSFPPWMVKRWMARFGAGETEALLSAMNTFPPLDVRVNLHQWSREDAAGELRSEGGETVPGSFSPAALRLTGLREATSLPSFRRGGFYIQDESAQLAALALAPRRGERILDACAGVGGKATHAAEITGDGAEVVAVDTDRGRLALLGDNVRRLGLSSVLPVQGDLLDGKFDPGGLFDRILLDAPCSSLGIIRRHPEFKWAKRASDIPRFAALQLRLLEGVSRCLARGGTLAYSTCTTEPEENEEVVRQFLDRHRDFAAAPVPGGAVNGIGEIVTPEGFIATFPHRHGTNGSFLALVRREADRD